MRTLTKNNNTRAGQVKVSSVSQRKPPLPSSTTSRSDYRDGQSLRSLFPSLCFSFASMLLSMSSLTLCFVLACVSALSGRVCAESSSSFTFTCFLLFPFVSILHQKQRFAQIPTRLSRGTCARLPRVFSPPEERHECNKKRIV